MSDSMNICMIFEISSQAKLNDLEQLVQYIVKDNPIFKKVISIANGVINLTSQDSDVELHQEIYSMRDTALGRTQIILRNPFNIEQNLCRFSIVSYSDALFLGISAHHVLLDGIHLKKILLMLEENIKKNGLNFSEVIL